jgi:hypothetical protein
METILIIILILLLLGVIPFGSRRGWGWGRSGLIQLLLLIFIIWLVLRVF